MAKAKGGSTTPPAAKRGKKDESTPDATKKIPKTPPPPPAKQPTQPTQDQPPAKHPIQDHPDIQTAPSVPEQPERSNTFFLRFSTVAKPFNLPPHPEVALVAMEHFQQEGMKCIPFFIRGEKCYKLELREEVTKNGHALNFQHFSVPLLAWEKKASRPSNKEDGLLLTFRRAGEGPLESVPAEFFDRAMQDLKLKIIVSTKMQRVKDTRVLNGNRFCVVEKPENNKVIPESFPVEHPLTKERFQVHLNFKGQERYCHRCNEMHVGLCPEIQARIAAENERNATDPSTVKMYGDSTLRCVDALGLRSEVLGMSGGGLGQVVQAVIDDPEGEKMDNVLIFGGANDAKTENFVSNEHYAANIDLCLKKLADHAQKMPNKSFVLVQQVPSLPETGNLRSTCEAIREVYLSKRIDELTANVSNVRTCSVHYEADATGHPTPKGTREIIESLNEAHVTPTPLIWNPDYIATEKPYSKIQSIYRYGCNGCPRFGSDLVQEKYSCPLLCDICIDEIPNEPNEQLRIIEELAANNTPSAGMDLS